MAAERPRILVIGAGVNGSAVASRLFRAGLDVQVLARGARYEEILEHGIIIENPFNQTRSVTRVPAINRLEREDLYDFLLVIVRKNQVANLLPLLAHNQSPNIVFMGNNLSGPEEFTQIVDRRRIMLGTVVAGGKRDGEIIRAFMPTPVASPFGEMEGTITPRLKWLVSTLRSAGIRAEPSTQMIDHLMTHAAGVAVIGKLTMKYACDLHALARATADLNLIVQARREAHQVLRTLGHKIVPAAEDAIRIIPEFLQVAGMRALLNSRLGEVGLAYHVSQAPDEMQQLGRELCSLVEQAALPAPAIRTVFAPFQALAA